MAKSKSTAVVKPNLGLYLTESPLTIPTGALSSGYNFRIERGQLSNLNLGWTALGTPQVSLNGPVLYFDFFFVNAVNERNVFATLTDLYSYNPANDTVVYITPVYVTGTASASGTAVTGTGTAWDTNDANGNKNAQAGFEIAFGDNAENDPDATWYTIDSVGGDEAITLTASAGTVADGPYTIRRMFSGSVSDRWSSDFFLLAGGSTDYWYATNGVDPVVKWDGTSTFAEFTEFTFTCKTLRVYNNMMIYGAVTESGTFKPATIINSNVGDPEDFTGLSEEFRVYEDVNPILLMVPLADNLVIYSRRRISMAQFVGDVLVFVFRQVVSELGPVSAGLIADLGDFHEFVATDGQYFFDGVQVKQSANQVWPEILRSRDPNRDHFAFHHFNEEHGDLMWVIPAVTDPGTDSDDPPATAWVEHYLEDVEDKYESPYSARSCPFTAAGYTERRGTLTWDQISDGWDDLNYRWNDQFFFVAYPFSIMGDVDGNIWLFNSAQTAAGAALPSHIRFNRFALGDGRMRGLLARIYPFVEEFQNNLQVTARLFNSASAEPDITDTFEFPQTLAIGAHFQSIYRRGRFAEVQFGSATGLPYVVDGYDIDVKKGGFR